MSSGKRSRKSGFLLGMAVFGGVLVGASPAFSEGHPAPETTHASREGTFSTALPSKLDYLVLASLADSHSLLLSSAYRAPPVEAMADVKKVAAAAACPEGE